jgi:hypothetical protein
MSKGHLLAGILILCVCLLQTGCSIPRRIWRQDDIEPYEVNAPSREHKVLLASSKSDFKDAVISRIRQGLEGEDLYLKVIGLGDLEHEDATAYDAVIVINRCVAWGMDPDVDSFLERYDDHENMIVLTTSGDGDWLPDMKGRNFDAVSAASKQAQVDETAGEIISKVRLLLGSE